MAPLGARPGPASSPSSSVRSSPAARPSLDLSAATRRRPTRSTSAASSSSPGEIRVRVTNPQPDAITIASVTVDDAIVPFTRRRAGQLKRLRSSTVVVPYDWVAGRADRGRHHQLDRDRDGAGGPGRGRDADRLARRASSATASSASWSASCPSRWGCSGCRRCGGPSPQWLAAFMALTAGLLSFLGVEALFEAFQLQAALPGRHSAAPGSSCSASRSATSAMTFLSARLRAGGKDVGGMALALLVALGIGVHNLGEGLAIGTLVRVRRAHARNVPDRRLHDPQRHRRARHRRAGRRRRRQAAHRDGSPRSPLVAGAPADPRRLDRRLRRRATSSASSSSRSPPAPRSRSWSRSAASSRGRAPGGLTSGYAVGGFLAGIAIMYATGLLAG